jgi:hypothetical protein
LSSNNHNLDFYEFLPRFKSLEIEQEFRSSFLKNDKFLARLIIAGSILIGLFSIVPDSISGVEYTKLQAIYLSTFSLIYFNLMLLGLLIFTHKQRHFDIIATTWWLSVILTVTISNTLYPPEIIIHVVFDIMIPVAIYLLIPIGLVSQFILAALFTAANLILLFVYKTTLSPTDTGFILLAYITVHLLGIVSCWQIHLSRRKQFIEQKSEQFTRMELQKTLDEIKVLRGIIPICSYCKQIRDDEGFWHQVENYIRKHSGADFTHGICPGCMQENFPREFDRIKAQEQREATKNDE